ncbi:extracellular solute-binding protein [Vallitalea okinawensis]|uniref:extracellular solute-binding protein n=1 Tax=Vallitalea okinawensis TaxID=2078660 RepID=UPI000CFD8B6C|nr:extracellular solute-binding protein [Vallitalea okinawensis]
MKIYKKIIALCLGATLVFTGCSGETDTNSNTETNDDKNIQVTANFNETGYPIVDEEMTLSVMFAGATQTESLESMPSIQNLKELTNIGIDVEFIGGDDFRTKVNLVLASGDLPDVILGGEGLKDVDILNNKEYFYPLDDYLQYAPNVQKMFEEVPILKKIATAPDGHIYSLPSYRPFRPQVNNAWIINTTWLDNLGLDMPTTTEEFYSVLKAFKEEDANGNGDPNDELPFTTDPSGMFSYQDLFNAFGITNTANFVNEKMDIRDGKVRFTPITEEYKEAMKYMRRLLEEELINPELFTATDFWTIGQVDSNGGAKVGVITSWTAPQMVGQWADQYEVLLPLEGPNGHRGITNELMQTTVVKNPFVIPRTNKNPEATMRWINEWYGEDMTVQAFFGSFGEGTKKNDDGTYSILPPADDTKNPDEWKWIKGVADPAPVYFSEELQDKILDADFHKLKASYDDLYGDLIEPIENTFPMMTWAPEESTELSTLYGDIYTYVDRKAAEWMMNGGIEEEWDDYIKEINKMGYDRLMEIYQTAYDRFMN